MIRRIILSYITENNQLIGKKCFIMEKKFILLCFINDENVVIYKNYQSIYKNKLSLSKY